MRVHLNLLLLACFTSYALAIQVPWEVLPFASRIQAAFLDRLNIASAPSHRSKVIRLQQVYHQGTIRYPGLSARLDVGGSSVSASSSGDPHDVQGILRTKRVKTWKPRNTQDYLHAHRHGDGVGIKASLNDMVWDEIEVDAPDVEDRETLLTLAKMASKAYEEPSNKGNGDWTIGGKQEWNLSSSFGWENDGIRGHVFATEDNSTIVVALKGTSAALLDNGSTSKRDKDNDNLFFSCCCARVGWTWHTVCDCYGGDDDKAQSSATSPTLSASADEQTCRSSCLSKALIKKSFYYPATTDLFNNISYAYPNSQIWITGHSLGGALGAMLGMTFGNPTVTFEAPAERMAALRLHLPLPTKHGKLHELPITHVYHTADPIPMGECVGAASLCANFGFAMESRCHSGHTILYDTVEKLGWSSSVTTHRIATLVEDLLMEDWDKKVSKAKTKLNADAATSRWRLPWSRSKEEEEEPNKKKLGSVPSLRSEAKCRDCSDWKFTDDDGAVSQGLGL